MVWLLSQFLLSGFLIAVGAQDSGSQESLCPCESSIDRNVTVSALPLNSRRQRILCIKNSTAAESVFAAHSPKSLNLNYRFVSGRVHLHNGKIRSGSLRLCSVLLAIVDEKPIRILQQERCPGICEDVPIVIVPSQFFRPSAHQTQRTFSRCSLNITVTNEPNGNVSSLAGLLHLVVMQRLAECDEQIISLRNSWNSFSLTKPTNNASSFPSTTIVNGQDFHQHYSLSKSLPRRPLFGVIIWVASVSRLSMAENQAKVRNDYYRLHGQSHNIAAWIATEETYPCLPGSNICGGSIRQRMGQSEYMVDMPFTILDKKSTLPGWACAQRRPLRAVAHVLSLYNPDFLLVVDDDTFVNMKYFNPGSVLNSFIQTTMRTENVVIGELNGDMRKITARGFYYGGAGYLMGRGILSRLTSHSIDSQRRNDTDAFRTTSQTTNLGVLDQVLRLWDSPCTDCVASRIPAEKEYMENGAYPIRSATMTIRVIDLCVNMMAQIDSCYHSDHALTRCLSHGIYADTLSAGCYDPISIQSVNGRNLSFSMCYDGEKCDINTTLTCHRHVANTSNTLLQPISTLGKKIKIVR